MSVKYGQAKILVMGTVGEHFYIFDNAFNGLQVSLEKLFINGRSSSLNLTSGRAFSLQWTDVTLPKDSFTPDKSTGFLYYKQLTVGANVEEMAIIAVFSDDRKMLATKALEGRGSEEVPRQVTVSPNSVFLTVTSNEAHLIAYYDPATGALIFTHLTNLLSNQEEEK